MAQSPRRTRGSPSSTLFDTFGVVSIAVGTRVDVSIDVSDPSRKHLNHSTSGASSASLSATNAFSKAPSSTAVPTSTAPLPDSGATIGCSTAAIASALVNSYYRFASPSVAAQDEAHFKRGSNLADFDKFENSTEVNLLMTKYSANEVVTIADLSATASLSPMSTGVLTVADNAASTLEMRDSRGLQPSIAPMANVALSEPTWLAATVVRHRTEVDARTGLEVVSGYDVVFEEQSTVRTSENESWADGELDVCPKRLRSPSLLPTAADCASANAAGSANSAPVRTRVTRGSAAAGSALPGTRVVVDYGDDGLDLGIVGDVIRSAPGCFMVSFTDGTEEQFQWFEIAKCQSERPPTATGYLIPLDCNITSKEEEDLDVSKKHGSSNDGSAFQKRSSTLYGWKKASSKQLSGVKVSRKRLSQEEEFERLEMIAAAAARGDVNWVPPWLQEDADDDEAATDDEASTVNTIATSTKASVSVEAETTASMEVETDTGDLDEWVQCEACEKWRRLPSDLQVDTEKWLCAMNYWAPDMASCDATEETFSASDDSLQPHATIAAAGVSVLLKPSPESEFLSTPAVALEEASSEALDEWVQCDACSKWRKVKEGEVNSSEVWVCTLNSDSVHQRCEAPEESWDSQEWDENQMEASTGEIDLMDNRDADESMVASGVADSLELSLPIDQLQTYNESTDIVDRKPLTWEEEFQLLEVSAKLRTDATSRSRRVATDRKPSEDESSSHSELIRWKCVECAVVNKARSSACFRCGHRKSDESTRAAAAKRESQVAALAAAKAAYQARRREQQALRKEGRKWDYYVGGHLAHGGDLKRARSSRNVGTSEEKEPEEIDELDDIDTEDDAKRARSSRNMSTSEEKEPEETDELDGIDTEVVAAAGAVGKRQREDLVVSFSLFDSGGTAYPYYRLCALRGVAALADGLPTSGVDTDSSSSTDDSVDVTNGSSEIRRVRFVVHCDHLVDDSTLVALSAAARGRLTAVRYTTTSRQYNKTCWLISAMRYRTLWETKTSETAVSLDIHDDSAMQLKLIARLENRLDDEHKQVGFTYWRASGKECENGSALPVRLGVGGAHAHTDGGLLLWRSDEHKTSKPKSFYSNGGKVPIEASSSAQEEELREGVQAPKLNGETSHGARRAVMEHAGTGFVTFVEESMQACNHDKIRGCDEMLLDGYLHDLVRPEHALWQKHAHSIRATPGTHKKVIPRGKSAAGDGRDPKKGTMSNHSLAVDWIHLAVGDGKTGPSILCCPEEHPRKKHRVAPSDATQRSARQSKDSKAKKRSV